jgi:DNA-binding response OmpR family regulator
LRPLDGVPVIALIAVHDDAVTALAAGAEDALSWPPDPRELALRIETVLRRTAVPPDAPVALTGPGTLRLWPRAHEVRVGDVEVNLTPREFTLLQLMLERRGEVVTADDVAEALWGEGTLGERNFVEAHVSRLRAKLRAAGALNVIATVRGVGYKIPKQAQ